MGFLTEEAKKVNKPYTIDKIYADAQITPEGITGVVESELRICLKGEEFEKFQKQSFYTVMIKYLENIEKHGNSLDTETWNGEKRNFWNTGPKTGRNSKEAKTVKVKLDGYKKVLKQIREIKKEMKQLNKAAKEFAELKEKLF